MIPPIAKFTVGMNTLLTVIVAVDVSKDLNRYKKKATKVNKNDSNCRIQYHAHDGSLLPKVNL
jgi:hypothetical protein